MGVRIPQTPGLAAPTVGQVLSSAQVAGPVVVHAVPEGEDGALSIERGVRGFLAIRGLGMGFHTRGNPSIRTVEVADGPPDAFVDRAKRVPRMYGEHFLSELIGNISMHLLGRRRARRQLADEVAVRVATAKELLAHPDSYTFAWTGLVGAAFDEPVEVDAGGERWLLDPLRLTTTEDGAERDRVLHLRREAGAAGPGVTVRKLFAARADAEHLLVTLDLLRASLSSPEPIVWDVLARQRLEQAAHGWIERVRSEHERRRAEDLDELIKVLGGTARAAELIPAGAGLLASHPIGELLEPPPTPIPGGTLPAPWPGGCPFPDQPRLEWLAPWPELV